MTPGGPPATADSGPGHGGFGGGAKGRSRDGFWGVVPTGVRVGTVKENTTFQSSRALALPSPSLPLFQPA